MLVSTCLRAQDIVRMHVASSAQTIATIKTCSMLSPQVSVRMRREWQRFQHAMALGSRLPFSAAICWTGCRRTYMS